jgi:SAM-dependent methyltransferase
MIKLINPFNELPIFPKGEGYADSEGNYFPLIRGALRIVNENNYTDSFGFQWNKFQATQIDRESKNSSQSKERFFAETGWEKEDLSNVNVLEVGSGAGRFSQIALDYTKANLYSVDYSDAVSANFKNNGHHGDRFKLFQASIYEMPFADNGFDKVFCFGVLQHTPDFKKSVKSLIDKVKPGGELIVDFYPVKGWWTKIHAKYIFRPLTKRISHEKLLRIIEKNADRLIKLYFFFDKIGIGRFVNRFLPVCDIKGTLPPGLSKEEMKEWVILDTFDMFSPEHDHPQKIAVVANWFKEFGMEVTFSGYVPYSIFKASIVKGIKK